MAKLRNLGYGDDEPDNGADPGGLFNISAPQVGPVGTKPTGGINIDEFGPTGAIGGSLDGDLGGGFASRSGETPRERAFKPAAGNAMAAPGESHSPKPQAGQQIEIPGRDPGAEPEAGMVTPRPQLRPFKPMADIGGGMANTEGGMYGSLGGLQGGGLGLPFDPQSNQQSDISSLIQALMRAKAGG